MDILPYLLSVAAAIVGWLVGVATSTFLQDREHYRQQRGAIGVLLTELTRIRSQLGGTDDHWIDSGILGNQAAIPEIHPWVQASITDVAQTDPSVLAHFMQLDLLLSNQALFVKAMRERRDEVRTAVEQLRQNTAAVAEATGAEAVPDQILAKVAAKQEREQRETVVRQAVQFVDMNHKNILTALTSLTNLLNELDNVLRREPAFDARRLLGAHVFLLRDRSDVGRQARRQGAEA